MKSKHEIAILCGASIVKMATVDALTYERVGLDFPVYQFTKLQLEAFTIDIKREFINQLRGIPSIGLSERQFGELTAVVNKSEEEA